MRYSWALDGSSYPTLTRKTLDLKLIDKAPLKIAHDDEVSIEAIERFRVDADAASGNSIRSAALSGMAFDITRIRKKQ